jgi:tetratricopeptide (TPR) repeat protein
MSETDLFFHLKIGDLILQRHAIPFVNLFSFTYPDHPDPDLSWGFQVMVSVLYRLGGFAAIVLLKTLLVTGAAALVWRAMRQRGVGPRGASPDGAGGSRPPFDQAGIREAAAAIALVVLAETAHPRMVERPHLVTFVGIGALLVLLGEYERGRARAAWLLPPLVLVWSNFHAGVFFAPLVTGCFLVGAWVDRDRTPMRSLRTLAIALAASVPLLFATPAGFRLLPYLGWHTGVASSREIDEFRHAEPWSDPWFFIMIALCVLALLVLRRRIRARQILPLVVVGILAARSVRFVAEWAFLAAPLVASGLDEALRGLKLPRPELGRAGIALAIGAIVLWQRSGQPFAIGLDRAALPLDAVAFVTETGLRQRMYADLDLGCYLLWEGWPRWQVFQDARLPAYPHEFHRALDQTPLDPPSWDALLQRYGVDAALLSDPGINIRAGSFDEDEWALVFRQKSALVFARRTPAHAAVINRNEIPLRVRFSYFEGSRVEAIPVPPARSPVAPCEWDRRLADALENEADSNGALDARARALAHGCLGQTDEASVRFRLGARAQLGGQLRTAMAEYDRVLALAPENIDARVNRAFARLKLGDREGARADFENARKADPNRPDIAEGLKRLDER